MQSEEEPTKPNKPQGQRLVVWVKGELLEELLRINEASKIPISEILRQGAAIKIKQLQQLYPPPTPDQGD